MNRRHQDLSNDMFLSTNDRCLYNLFIAQRWLVKGRLQNPTAGWPAVLSGSGRLSLFRTIETGLKRSEPAVNRRLGFEAVPNKGTSSKEWEVNWIYCCDINCSIESWDVLWIFSGTLAKSSRAQQSHCKMCRVITSIGRKQKPYNVHLCGIDETIILAWNKTLFK